MNPAASHPVRIAVQLQPQHADYAQIREALARAEDLGVDVVFTWDHFFPLSGAPEGKHFECWTVLGAWAEQTSRVEIGALVTCNSYRNPDLLADMARTVDHISGGRLILGIGPGARIADLGQALPRIEARLAAVNPPPVRPIPVLIGGGGERKTLRLVAQHADIWHSFGSVGTLTRKSAILDEHCAAVGREPGQIERSVGVSASPAEVAEPLVAAGATLFTIGIDGPEYDLSLVREWVAWRDARS